MADLIDRQKIKARLEPWLNVKGYSDGELNMLKAVLYEITIMPSAQPDVPDTTFGNMISRQAAINAIENTDCELPPCAWDELTDAIMRVPSADIDLSGFSDKLWVAAYERGKAEAVRWIPVSEQLPEDEQEVLFSTKTGRVHHGRYYNDNSVNQWYSSLDKMRAWNNVVNAWMPLPEHYKDGEQDG